MKHGFLKTAAITFPVRVADPKTNAARLIKASDEVLLKGAKVLVFPELCLTGATAGDLFFQHHLISETEKALERILAHTKKTGADAVYFIGMPLEVSGKLYDVCAVVQAGNLLAFVPKSVLSSSTMLHPSRQFTEASDEVTDVRFLGKDVPFGTDFLFDFSDTMRGLVIACEIGEEVFTADAPHVRHAFAGATLIVCPFAMPSVVTLGDRLREVVKTASGTTHCAIVLAGAGEGESSTDCVFASERLIAENGTLLADGTRFSSGTTYADIDIFRLVHERKRDTLFPAADTGYHEVLSLSMECVETTLHRTFAASPFVPVDIMERNRRAEEILTMQAAGLARRMEHIGCRDAVLGVSGGLDSTLALCVTVRAFAQMGLDNKRIHAITMPSFGTTDRTYTNACNMVRLFGATLSEINIAEAVRVHFRDIGHDETVHDATYENAQARERTQILMDIANQCNGLVVGTGDLSELALGWATYNGDHMSMYGVNAGVPKTLVRYLVRYCAERCEDDALKETLLDVVETPVSPELLPADDGKIAQKTEDLIGPYELHDFFLYYRLRYGYEKEKLLRIAEKTFDGRYPKEELEHWLDTLLRRFTTQQFKRSCLPDGVGIGSVTLSPRGGLIMPSDAALTE